MNEFFALFCIIAPLIAILPVIAMVKQNMQAAALEAAKAELKEQARERALAIREAKAIRDAELHNAKLAAEHNKVVLQDAKLEIEALKLRELQFKTRHMTVQPFEPVNHEPGV